jgi:hypothetical protein
MLAARITLAHFSVDSITILENSSCVLANGVYPSSVVRVLNLESATQAIYFSAEPTRNPPRLIFGE